jgi:large conductance mechanosensitive channel
MGMIREFRDFAVRGNVADLAIAVVLGAAFGAIVKSAVDDLLMPPLGLVTGGSDFTDKFALLQAGDPAGPYPTLEAAKAAGAVTLNWGLFVNHLVSFLLVAFAVFLLVRAMNRLRPPAPAAVTTKPCGFCRMEIPLDATRCPHCTSQLVPA